MIRILCAGAGNMGRSHALAYHNIPDFEIVGICTRSPGSREALNEEMAGGYALFEDFYKALKETKPDAVSISTYPDTHAPFAKAAFEAGCDVFIEKPLADTRTPKAKVAVPPPRPRLVRRRPNWQQVQDPVALTQSRR